MMKALLLKRPGELVLVEVPVPEISDDDVLVEVRYCGICGSDVHAVAKGGTFKPGTYLGHEISGVIAKLGRNVKGWHIGDRVVANPLYLCGDCYACMHGRHSLCDHGFERAIGCVPGLEYAGGFAKYVKISLPEKKLYRLPDEVSLEEGALIDCLSDALHAVRVSGFRVGQHVAVLGCGPIGLAVIAFLKYAGAGLIVAVEVKEKRSEVAVKLGADRMFNPIEEPRLSSRVLDLTNGDGVDMVFDCSGVAEAFQSATGLLRKGGKVVIVGVITEKVPITPFDWTVNEWQLQGSMCYYHDEPPIVIEFLKRGVPHINDMITSKIKLSNIIEKGFKILTEPSNNEIKILVQPD